MFISVEAQVEATELSVEVVGRNVVFIGESVEIRNTCNVSVVNFEIYSPDNMLVYSGVQSANSSFTFTPSMGYGLYTVKAYAGDTVAETWFWMQDTRNMAVAPSSFVTVWKGLTCSFSTVFEAGKISTYLLTVSFETASLTLDWLSEVFTKLKPIEVKVESNGECIHIKTYSAKNKIDSWIMNTWFGVKIRVNGTLEKSTTFKWNFKNVYGDVLWMLDGLRVQAESAGLVYDYSDLNQRSYGCHYTLDKTNMKLDVYLEPNFDVDPVIFQDGFESGDFSTWTETSITSGASLTVETTNPHHGSYSARSYIFSQPAWTNAFCKKNLGTTYSEVPVYFRVYVYVDNFSSTGHLRGFMHLRGSGRVMFTVGLHSNRALRLYRFHNGSYYNTISTTILDLDTWYCVEIKGVADIDGSGDGEVRVYLNGNEVSDLTFTNQIHDSYSGLRYVEAGCIDGYNTEATIYIDCVVVADTYIGPEPEAPPGQEYSYTFTETVKPSVVLNQWQEQNRIFAETIRQTSIYQYGAELIIIQTQTIQPTSTHQYWIEMTQTFIETIQPSDILKILLETAEVFVTQVNIIKPRETVRYWIEQIKPPKPLWYHDPKAVLTVGLIIFAICFTFYTVINRRW